ncbi:MAG TPA: LLM class F420-dependent oxidoreductase [Solirubrobacteraceae bacterium]|nr:LLM class F420-dependent oxidoreductase [Solirubrobacteraceae bacterium]
MAFTRFGLHFSSTSYPNVTNAELFDRIVEAAQAAEAAGFDSIWVPDHAHQNDIGGGPSGPMLEAYTLLGGLAARTSRVSLGTMVTGVTYRNPALLAKEVTTLDILSSGRAILGIGGAWNEDEHVGYGFDFPPIGERLDRLEEALQICRAMFTEEAPSFSGRHYRIHQALNFPRPIRPEGIPILIGGGGERRTLRLVAQYADACNLFGDLETIRHKLDVLERHCEAVGRDPATITKTRLGSLVIAETAERAEEKARAMIEERGIDEERFRATTTVGDPDTVCEQVSELLDAGLDGLVFNMYDAQDLDPVRLAGESMSQAFPAAQAS